MVILEKPIAFRDQNSEPKVKLIFPANLRDRGQSILQKVGNVIVVAGPPGSTTKSVHPHTRKR
jgi:hypothetical protein